MINWSWILTSGQAVLMVVLTALAVYTALVAFTRAAGLRSFSKLSSFDFAVTVSFGSLLASAVITEDPPVLQAIAGLAVLYAIQYGVSILRLRSGVVVDLVDNSPILLMVGSEMLRDNMRRARVTEADLLAKLREANVTRMAQIKVVVLETTGDVSVLHGEADAPSVDGALLQGVRGADRLPQGPSGPPFRQVNSR